MVHALSNLLLLLGLFRPVNFEREPAQSAGPSFLASNPPTLQFSRLSRAPAARPGTGDGHKGFQ